MACGHSNVVYSSVSSALRSNEILELESDRVKAWFSLRYSAFLTAIWGLALTCFVILLLAVGTILFVYDANWMVLKPLEGMIAVVTRICDNPLDDLSNIDTASPLPDENRTPNASARALETDLLLSTFRRMKMYMELGFGV